MDGWAKLFKAWSSPRSCLGGIQGDVMCFFSCPESLLGLRSPRPSLSDCWSSETREPYGVCSVHRSHTRDAENAHGAPPVGAFVVGSCPRFHAAAAGQPRDLGVPGNEGG